MINREDKIVYTLLILVALALTYMVGYNKGANDGVDITLNFDPRCKEPK